jgi:cell division protein FtsL
MKRPIFIIFSLAFIVVVLSVVRVTMINNISTTGIEFSKLQKELETYKKQNELLKEQYLQASSFTNIEEKAKQLGFIHARAHLYMDSSVPLALR